MEKLDPNSPEWGYMGRKLFAVKLWTRIPARGIIGEHLHSLEEWPRRERARSSSMHKAMESVMKQLEKTPGLMN